MPPGVPPIALFRVFARNLPMTKAMHGWGRYELNRQLSLSLRDREILIDRTCARCGCEYEWGVHAAVFGPQVGLTGDKLAATVTAAADDKASWTAREALLVALVDELHDTATISDATWEALIAHYDAAQLVELVALTGQYHAVSFMANALGVEHEDAAERFPAAKAA